MPGHASAAVATTSFGGKFNLDFEVIDSDSTFQLRRHMGIDTNPWKAFPRIITSMDYLRMPDVLQQFLQASGAGPDADADGRTLAHAPWDLLIVDECHHFAPQSGSRASQRTRMLREIRFLFEHRIFASATPHNGKTVSFTGLLELLDPIRFQMAVEMDETDRAEPGRECAFADSRKTSTSNSFARRSPSSFHPVELPLKLSPKESALYDALREYRKQGRAALANASAGGALAWTVHLLVADQTTPVLPLRLRSNVVAACRRRKSSKRNERACSTWPVSRRNEPKSRPRATTNDPCWKKTPLATAVRISGRKASPSKSFKRQVKQALEALGYDRKTAEDPNKLAMPRQKSDSKTEALVDWIKTAPVR